MGKKFEIIGDDISDGYHTFDELYQHRVALFLYALRHGAFKGANIIRDHFEGWDCIKAFTTAGEQISYHVPVSERHLYPTDLCETPDEWDGHQSKDVLIRLNRS